MLSHSLTSIVSSPISNGELSSGRALFTVWFYDRGSPNLPCSRKLVVSNAPISWYSVGYVAVFTGLEDPLD